MSRQHAYSREELLATARGELFSHSNARLPNDPMLMFKFLRGFCLSLFSFSAENPKVGNLHYLVHSLVALIN